MFVYNATQLTKLVGLTEEAGYETILLYHGDLTWFAYQQFTELIS